MPFFQPLPPPPPEPAFNQPTGWRPPLWDRPSEALLGATVGASLLLAKTDRLALVFDRVHAYPNGFTFALGIVGNPMASRDPMSHGPMGIGPQMHLRGPRIGFEYADGTQVQVGGLRSHFGMPSGASTQWLVASGLANDDNGVPIAPVLMPRGGGGNNERFDQTFWCFRLPSPGPMTIYVEWADQDIEETAVSFDADLIVGAVPRVITIWETEPQTGLSNRPA